MKTLFHACLLTLALTLCGCAARRSEGQFTASYYGINVSVVWHTEPIK